MEQDDISFVKSCVSVARILRGRPIADSYLKAPKRWIAKFALWTKGRKIDLIKDISYNQRASQFEKLNIPKHLKILHFVGVPLATKISTEIKKKDIVQ